MDAQVSRNGRHHVTVPMRLDDLPVPVVPSDRSREKDIERLAQSALAAWYFAARAARAGSEARHERVVAKHWA
jgi:hypothetical protein